MPQISKRLQFIGEQVPKGFRAADVGTDHGFLPIYLIRNREAPYVIASDIRQGPLAAARRNIEEAGLETLIETRLGPGLETVKAGEVDAVVIAGMGGKTIAEILQGSEAVVSTLQCLVLQPMGASRFVRQYLHDHKFHIFHEDVFYDADRTYELITAVPRGALQATPHEADYVGFEDPLSLSMAYEYGPYLLRQPTRAFVDALESSLKRWKASAQGLEQARSEAAAEQKAETQQRIDWMENWLHVNQFPENRIHRQDDFETERSVAHD